MTILKVFNEKVSYGFQKQQAVHQRSERNGYG